MRPEMNLWRRLIAAIFTTAEEYYSRNRSIPTGDAIAALVVVTGFILIFYSH